MSPVPPCRRNVNVVVKFVMFTRALVNTLPASKPPPSVSRATLLLKVALPLAVMSLLLPKPAE